MEKELTKIGYISKAHGFKGELKCTLEFLLISDDFPNFLWLYINGKPVPFFVEKTEDKKQAFILKLEDIEDEDSAMNLKNTSIYCEKNILNQYFEKEESLEDMIGFNVEDINKGNIGIVHAIIENTIQPTLVLKLNEKEILIPYTEDIILEINIEKQFIKIDAPEGLIEMYIS